jgi:hypothetical protein
MSRHDRSLSANFCQRSAGRVLGPYTCYATRDSRRPFVPCSPRQCTRRVRGRGQAREGNQRAHAVDGKQLAALEVASLQTRLPQPARSGPNSRSPFSGAPLPYQRLPCRRGRQSSSRNMREPRPGPRSSRGPIFSRMRFCGHSTGTSSLFLLSPTLIISSGC